MPHVELADAVFKAAQRQATRDGFDSVDEYVAKMIVGDADAVDGDIASLFTPERLAAIDRGMADVRAGRVFTPDQLDVELAKRRAMWVEANGR